MSLGGANELSSVSNSEHCRIVHGMVGAEDIEFDASTNIAYVSADDRRSHSMGVQEAGAIYRVSFIDGEPDIEKMQGTEALSDFHPHGISYFNENGKSYLYVISHRFPEDASKGHDIYLFHIDGCQLKQVDKLEHDLIHSPNDIVALAQDEFYFTNDRKAVTGTSMFIEVLLGLARSGVVHYKEGRYRQLVDDLAFANGIAFQQSSNTLWVSESRGSALRAYRRDVHTGDLELLEIMPLGNSPDNISVTKEGDLLVADHVNGVSQIRNVSDAAHPSPSRVWRIGKNGEHLQIALDGNRYSAVSVAVGLSDKQWLLGSIYNEGLLICAANE
nr:SMP-30/gluconolactonase/LRE family protein [Pseudoteredinibacter isoporae]